MPVTDQISSLTTAQIAALTTADVASLTTVQVQELNTAQIQSLTTAQVVVLGTSQVKAIEIEDVVALTTAQFAKLTTAQVAILDTNQVRTIETRDIAAFTTAQLAALTTNQLTALNPAQVTALNTAQLASLSTAGISNVLITTASSGACFKIAEFTLLSAVGTAGAGTGRLIKIEPSVISWQITTSGTPAACCVTLQGSQDNVTYVNLDTSYAITNEIKHITGGTYKYYRAYLNNISGGTSPKVTVVASFKQSAIF